LLAPLTTVRIISELNACVKPNFEFCSASSYFRVTVGISLAVLLVLGCCFAVVAAARLPKRVLST